MFKFLCLKSTVKKLKTMPQSWIKYLYNIYLTKDLQLNKTGNSVFLNEQMMWTDMSPKKIYRWLKHINRFSTLLFIRALQIKTKCDYSRKISVIQQKKINVICHFDRMKEKKMMISIDEGKTFEKSIAL